MYRRSPEAVTGIDPDAFGCAKAGIFEVGEKMGTGGRVVNGSRL